MKPNPSNPADRIAQIRRTHLHLLSNEDILYHRDEKGVIVKANDHLMDAWRYFVRSGRDKMTMKPKTQSDRREDPRPGGKTWMAN